MSTLIADTAAEESVQAVDFRAGQNLGDAQVGPARLCRPKTSRIPNVRNLYGWKSSSFASLRWRYSRLTCACKQYVEFLRGGSSKTGSSGWSNCNNRNI